MSGGSASPEPDAGERERGHGVRRVARRKERERDEPRGEQERQPPTTSSGAESRAESGLAAESGERQRAHDRRAGERPVVPGGDDEEHREEERADEGGVGEG